jgi:hypothetical protein
MACDAEDEAPIARFIFVPSGSWRLTLEWVWQTLRALRACDQKIFLFGGDLPGITLLPSTDDEVTPLHASFSCSSGMKVGQ